jgi:hypothetical protein
MNLSNTLYDKLKFLAQVVLPALAAFIVAFNGIWDINNQDRIVATIAALNTALGLFLAASARQYEGAGDLVVTTDATDGSVYLAADLNKHPNAFKNKRNVVLNVKHQDLDVAA